jgi:hypothetical protein
MPPKKGRTISGSSAAKEDQTSEKPVAGTAQEETLNRAETPSASKKVPLSDGQSNAGEEDEGDTFEDLELVSIGKFWCHVLFSRATANLKSRILDKIGELIRDTPSISADCIYVADFENVPTSDPELMRIYVSFEKEEDLRAFQAIKTVEVASSGPDDGAKKFVFNITQPDVWYKAGEDGSVKAMMKNIPKGWSNERCLRLLDRFRFKNAQRPCVKEAKDAMRLKHKGGLVPRGMMVCTITAHNDDPEFKELRAICFVPFGKGRSRRFTVYVGCTIQTCALCKEHGHLAEVHEKWASRTTGMKRKAAVGLIRRAKKRQTGLPESELMLPVVEDSSMEFVEDKGLGKEAWRCTVCQNDAGEAICGESFSQALKHVESEQHRGLRVPEGDLMFACLACLV